MTIIKLKKKKKKNFIWVDENNDYKKITDWVFIESCGCGLGPSPVRLG